MKTLIVLLFAACGSAPSEPTPTATASETAAMVPAAAVSVDDVAAMPQDSRVVIDVRTDAEWAAGHVPGAIHIPLSELESRLDELESHRDGDVYAICQSGGRSARASDILARHGYTVHNVNGGTGAWMAAGHPVE